MSNNTLSTIKTVAEAAKSIAELVSLVNDLREHVAKLTAEVNELRTEKAAVVKPALKERNIEDRKFSPDQIRAIFYMRDHKGMSGYAIAKELGENAPFIYNILKRKIYAEVNISNLEAPIVAEVNISNLEAPIVAEVNISNLEAPIVADVVTAEEIIEKDGI